MKNINGFSKEIIGFFTLSFFLFICMLILSQLNNSYPDNSIVQSILGVFSFLVKLFLDYGTPDPLIWIIRVGGLYVIYKKFIKNDNER